MLECVAPFESLGLTRGIVRIPATKKAVAVIDPLAAHLDPGIAKQHKFGKFSPLVHQPAQLTQRINAYLVEQRRELARIVFVSTTLKDCAYGDLMRFTGTDIELDSLDEYLRSQRAYPFHRGIDIQQGDLIYVKDGDSAFFQEGSSHRGRGLCRCAVEEVNIAGARTSVCVAGSFEGADSQCGITKVIQECCGDVAPGTK